MGPPGTVINVDDPRRRPYSCAWCGRSMIDSHQGRRRKYCKQSCRQRAYEQRALTQGTSIPADAVILTASEADAFGDRMFALRCAAEDLVTAVSERADVATLNSLGDDLLSLAREAERLR
ncbi:hypothetical protein G3I13_17055 [Streptomyces sp. SID6673]|nr:hypothetical protein [Streptomyces sp. SID11726]NEB26043.1 hypothetical protein [Streptomyces sp. SID6673]NED69861.1 hypothetical protein [Streptomyces sp. SID10244]